MPGRKIEQNRTIAILVPYRPAEAPEEHVSRCALLVDELSVLANFCRQLNPVPLLHRFRSKPVRVTNLVRDVVIIRKCRVADHVELKLGDVLIGFEPKALFMEIALPLDAVDLKLIHV